MRYVNVRTYRGYYACVVRGVIRSRAAVHGLLIQFHTYNGGLAAAAAAAASRARARRRRRKQGTAGASSTTVTGLVCVINLSLDWCVLLICHWTGVCY